MFQQNPMKKQCGRTYKHILGAVDYMFLSDVHKFSYLVTYLINRKTWWHKTNGQPIRKDASFRSQNDTKDDVSYTHKWGRR